MMVTPEMCRLASKSKKIQNHLIQKKLHHLMKTLMFPLNLM